MTDILLTSEDMRIIESGDQNQIKRLVNDLRGMAEGRRTSGLNKELGMKAERLMTLIGRSELPINGDEYLSSYIDRMLAFMEMLAWLEVGDC